jgi:DNA polymerase-3 subunit epsilon
MDFVTIDFETADCQRNCPCEIGLTIVEKDKIIETKSWLIKPYCYPNFDSSNIAIHGIFPDDVKNSPEFPELWREIGSLFENNFLMAHFASFDFSVLRATLNLYSIPFPCCTYGCTYIFSREIWKGLPRYGLAPLCSMLDIPLKHHRAAPDSMATAELAIKAFSKADIKSLDEIKEKLQVNLGYLKPNEYRPCRKIKQQIVRKHYPKGISKN